MKILNAECGMRSAVDGHSKFQIPNSEFPGILFLLYFVSRAEEAVPDEQGHTYGDRRITDVKHWPDTQIDEVNDISQPHTIDEIADRPTEDQRRAPECDRRHRRLGEQLPADPDNDAQRQTDKEHLLPFEQAKRCPGILHIGEREERMDQRHALAGNKRVHHEMLGESIGAEGKQTDDPRPSGWTGTDA